MCVVLAPIPICCGKTGKVSVAVFVVPVFIRATKSHASDERAKVRCFENDAFGFEQRIFPFPVADNSVSRCPLMPESAGQGQTWPPNTVLLKCNETLF